MTQLDFYDIGLVSFLLGIRTIDDLNNPSLVENLFENLIIAEIFKSNYHKNSLKEYWFWRNSRGIEIDLLTNIGKKYDIFEVKSTQTISYQLFKTMNYFDELSKGNTKSKTLIYGGSENQERSDFTIKSWNRI